MIMEKLYKLKSLLKFKNLDAYLIPKNNFYFLEELLPYEERLKYISDFTGSAGWAIVLSDNSEKSAIFSDGRYKIQIEKEVDKNFFEFINGGLSEILCFLKSKKHLIFNVGLDPNLLSIFDFDILKTNLSKTNIKLKKIDKNLIDKIWLQKPKQIINKVYKLPEKYSGVKSSNKIRELISYLNKHNYYGYILNRSDSLSWLLNVRGSELDYSPIFRGLAFIKNDGNIFIFTENLSIKNIFKNKKNIKIHQVNHLFDIINKIKCKTIVIDPKVTSIKVFSYLKKNKNKIVKINCPIFEKKTLKNNIEQKNAYKTHLIDGIAFLRFWYWFESTKDIQKFTEEDLSKKIYFYRSLNESFKGNSFPTISAIGKNAAIVHYRYKKNMSSNIKKNQLYLLDSGGQYLTGTTDVTRTLIIEHPSTKMSDFYTYVLKGHLAISNLVFPFGTCGRDIDAMARQYLWKCYKDYDHGTGHGVGCFLNVHEGPISISKNNNYKFLPGMFISNEPGYYKKNSFGIRIENIELVKKSQENENFLYFDTVTMIPYEKKLINKKLLNQDEIEQINKYHEVVYKRLIKFINEDEKHLKTFLKNKTSKI